MSFEAEIYHTEEGREVVEERQALSGPDLEAAQQQASEWMATKAAVLYRSTYVRIRQEGVIVSERAIGTEWP